MFVSSGLWTFKAYQSIEGFLIIQTVVLTVEVFQGLDLHDTSC